MSVAKIRLVDVARDFVFWPSLLRLILQLVEQLELFLVQSPLLIEVLTLKGTVSFPAQLINFIVHF